MLNHPPAAVSEGVERMNGDDLEAVQAFAPPFDSEMDAITGHSMVRNFKETW